MNTVPEKLGQRLRSLRQRVGLSQRELARRARVSNGAISTIEADKVSPSVSALRQILSALTIAVAPHHTHTEVGGRVSVPGIGGLK